MFDHRGEHFSLVAVVAMARNRVIGRDGAMPWRLPSDLKRYRALTMGRPMIMGRKTLDSIARVLDGRDTIVLTRSDAPLLDGAIRASGPDVALALAAECARSRKTNEIVIAGGAEIYALFLDRLDRVEMTLVDAEPSGDTVFPELPSQDWRSTGESVMARGERDSASARFLTLERR